MVAEVTGGEKLVGYLVNKFRYRKSNKIRAIVEDTINYLYKDIKPLIIKQDGDLFILSIPPGCNFKTFQDKLDYFIDATGYNIDIEKNRNSIRMKIITQELLNKYDYTFDYDHLKKMHLPVPIGYSHKGLIVKDLAEMLFMLIGGIPGKGKSNFIHTLITSLLTARADKCFVTVFDFKRVEYSLYLDKKGLIVEDERKAYEVLSRMNDKIDERNKWLKSVGEVKVYDLPAKERPPYLVCIWDELTEMQNKENQELTNRILRLGRNSGFVGLLATQRPSAKTFRNGSFTETRSLCDARLAFKTACPEGSKMVLDNVNASKLNGKPGRGIFKYEGEETEVQSMFLNPKHVLPMLDKKIVREDEIYNVERKKMLSPR